MRRLFALAMLLFALPAHAVMINNGLAPPNPANVIDGGYSIVWVRNVGCPPGWPAGDPRDPCPSPGAATEVSVTWGTVLSSLYVDDTSAVHMSGGYSAWASAHGGATFTMSDGLVSSPDVYSGPEAYGHSTIVVTGGEMDYLEAYDSSTVTMSGGECDNFAAHDYATVWMRGGAVRDGLEAEWDGVEAEFEPTVMMTGGAVRWVSALGFPTVGSPTVTISGGTISDSIGGAFSATVRIIGTDFALDGSPMPYGTYTSASGYLTGTLASGDALGVEIGVSGVSAYLILSPPTDCSDFVDSDGDGLVDFPDDPGCMDALSPLESSECQDGINNDPIQDPEPGLIDFDGGQSIHGQCTGVACVAPETWPDCGCPPGVSDPDGDGVANPDPQCVGKPWRLRESQSSSLCGLGAELVLPLPPLMWLSLWRRRRS